MALWWIPQGASASVEDFYFETFDGDYSISISQSGTAELAVTEKIVPVFPEYDQNRGMIRYLANWYDRAPLETKVLSLTDEVGNQRPLDIYSENDMTVVDSVVPEGQFLHGRQEYVLSYQQKNVIGDFTDTSGFQEFYWDINGNGWLQSFETVRATIHVPKELAAGLVQASSSCYYGLEGQDNSCSLIFTHEGDSVQIHLEQPNIGPEQTVTVAIAFAPGTFMIATRDPAEYPLNWLLIPLLLGLAFTFGAALRHNLTVLKGAAGRPAIVTEYQPPRSASLELSAQLLGKANSIPVSKLLEMAVAGKIKLSETKKANWAITRVSQELTSEELDILSTLFDQELQIGVEVALPVKDTGVAKRLTGYLSSLKRKTNSLYAQKAPLKPRVLLAMTALALAGISTLFGVLSVTNRYENAWVIGAMVLAISVAGFSLLLLTRTPLNSAGADLRDHLKGLKRYINLAEKDRLHFLQSPDGALRGGSQGYLKLHEELLPWAVMLGLGKKWMKELDKLYGDQAPAWVATGFHGSFYASMNSLSSATTSAFGSSTSGGAGGSGSAGGGGGGGGGGGR